LRVVATSACFWAGRIAGFLRSAVVDVLHGGNMFRGRR
jgi:hypothetical protein